MFDNQMNNINTRFEWGKKSNGMFVMQIIWKWKRSKLNIWNVWFYPSIWSTFWTKYFARHWRNDLQKKILNKRKSIIWIDLNRFVHVNCNHRHRWWWNEMEWKKAKKICYRRPNLIAMQRSNGMLAMRQKQNTLCVYK